jgi:CRP/FNR family transcriptional regulator, cyclic AMP receptor protein
MAAMNPYIQLLQRVNIFDNLPEGELETLSECLIRRTYLRDNTIVSQSDPGDSMFIIEQGRVKVVLYGEGGREVILTVFRDGDFFGEMSLLDGQSRSANVIAMEDSHLLILERGAFLSHLRAHPQTALNILAVMSQRLRRADEIIGNLALLDVYGRLGRLLQDMAQREGKPAPGGVIIAQRPTHQELASMIGTSRETVSRVLSDFQRQGLIATEGKSLFISAGVMTNAPVSAR